MEILSPYPRINKPLTFLFTAIGNEKEGLSFILSFLALGSASPSGTFFHI